MKNLNLLALTLVFFFLFSCKNKTELPLEHYGLKLEADTKTWENFDALVRRTLREKAFLSEQTRGQQFPLEPARVFFTENFINLYMPYWYGTKWSETGVATQPKKEPTSAANFVGTMLYKIDFKVNPYKFRSIAPKDAATALCLGEKMMILETNTSNAIQQIIARGDGVYYVGLDDNHHGFLLVAHDELFFIHANYLSPQVVMIEKANKSKSFKTAKTLYIAPLTEESVLTNWLKTPSIII